MALRALVDLVEGGDVRRLFSDAELLDMATAEELRATQKPSGHKQGNQRSRGAASPAKNGGPKNGSNAVASLSTMGEGSPTIEGSSGGSGSTSTENKEVSRTHALLLDPTCCA